MVYTFALGSRELYEFIDNNPVCASYSVGYTNNLSHISANDNVVSINNAIEVDLYGQVSSESSGFRHITGTGGQFDFAGMVTKVPPPRGFDIPPFKIDGKKLVLGEAGPEYTKMKEKVLGEVKKTFRPEFLNRIDATVVFHPLTKEHIRQIVDLMLNEIGDSLKEKNITLEVTEAAKDLLGDKGYDPVFGARPLRRTIQEMVENQLSEALLHGDFLPGDTVVVDCEGERIVMRALVRGGS